MSEYTLNIDNVTYEDAEVFHEVTGISFTKAVLEWRMGDLSAPALYGLSWLARRQMEPEYSFEEAKQLKWIDAAASLEVTEAKPDPTEAASSSDSRPSASSSESPGQTPGE